MLSCSSIHSFIGIPIQSHLNTLLPLPAWSTSPFFLANVTRVLNNIHGRYIDLFIDSIGGWHLDVFAGEMEDYFGNRTNHRMVLYSAVSDKWLADCEHYYQYCLLAFSTTPT